jgi:hypothetical protein
MPAITPIFIKNTLQVLRAELALQKRHGQLLEGQQLALLACDRARFAVLQEEYSQMLVLLEAQDTARRAALLDENGEPLTLAQLQALAPEKDQPTLAALEGDLRQVLELVQTLSRRNQALIQNELNYLAFSLDLFVEAGRNADNGYGSRHGFPGHARHTSLWVLDRRA